MIKLAFLNFKNSFKNYLALILSLAFTVLVLYNFQNLIDSQAFEVLGTRNRDYIEMLVQMVSFVLCCFMFFFIWYSTNVFLTGRKKEIGIYVFMGLSNEKIGKMYLMETIFIGLSSLILGLALGALSAGLFQLILLAISDITVVSAGNQTYGIHNRSLRNCLYDICGERLCKYCKKQCFEHGVRVKAE